MAESTAFPQSREANDVGYRRISGFAVAGLVVGILFVLFLLTQVVVGLISHSTVLIPIWLEFIAALGVGLSLLGMRSIRASDGTLAGLSLAKAGLWISLVAGLGYGSYYGATYLAIRQQADAFASDWFDKIRKGKLNQAFLLTQSPGVDRGANPDDESYMNMRFNSPQPGPKGTTQRAGPLDLFRYNEIVQMIKQGGEETKVTALGVRSWEKKEAAYLVKRVYGIDTPEGTFEVQISVFGTQGADSDKTRGWFVAFNETAVEKDSLKKTPIGKRIYEMRNNGSTFLNDWGAKVVAGNLAAAYFETLDPKDRKVAPPDGKSPFPKGALLDLSGFKSDDKTAHAALEVALRDVFSTAQDSNMIALAFVAMPNCAKRLWSVDGEKRVLLPVDLQILAGPKGSMPKYFADCVAWLQSEPDQLSNETTPHWRILRIEVLRAADIAEFQKAGAGGRMSIGRFD